MCCRFYLLQQDYRELLASLGISSAAEFLSRYNIAPGTDIALVRTKPDTRTREAARLRWGLVPGWAKSAEAGARLMNARAESLAEKPSFREAFRRRRGIIPASGFYEWQHVGREKRPWVFRRRDQRPLGLAALWESWRAPDGAVLETCTVITTEANELMRPIHDRMPVILTPEQGEAWLDPGVTAPEKLSPLLRPAPAAVLGATALAAHVNDARHDDPACLTPAGAEPAGPGPQLSLGL